MLRLCDSFRFVTLFGFLPPARDRRRSSPLYLAVYIFPKFCIFETTGAFCHEVTLRSGIYLYAATARSVPIPLRVIITSSYARPSTARAATTISIKSICHQRPSQSMDIPNSVCESAIPPAMIIRSGILPQGSSYDRSGRDDFKRAAGNGFKLVEIGVIPSGITCACKKPIGPVVCQNHSVFLLRKHRQICDNAPRVKALRAPKTSCGSWSPPTQLS